MRTLATLTAAVAMTCGGIAFADPASAGRPIVGYNYPDMCKNIKGKQPIYQVVGSGPYRVVKPGICRSRTAR